jgi:hypothetical protein
MKLVLKSVTCASSGDLRASPCRVRVSTNSGGARMGSWAEWGHALTNAAFFGGLLFLLWWGLNRRDEDTPRQRLLVLIAATYFGAASGLLDTFHSRLWRWPLSMVSTIIIISYLVVAFAFRQDVARNWTRDWNAWRQRLRRLLPRSRRVTGH